MISLRWFNCSFTDGSFCFKAFKKGDNFVVKQISIFKKSSEGYENIQSLFIFFKKVFFLKVIKLYNRIILSLRKINNKIGKFLKKATLKKGEENVSEYLRNVSEYKDQD